VDLVDEFKRNNLIEVRSGLTGRLARGFSVLRANRAMTEARSSIASVFRQRCF
jgi:hypothetical protein